MKFFAWSNLVTLRRSKERSNREYKLNLNEKPYYVYSTVKHKKQPQKNAENARLSYCATDDGRLDATDRDQHPLCSLGSFTATGTIADDTMSSSSRQTGFISVGALCQGSRRVFCVLVERVVLSVLRLKCSVKRREALRGRNLPRDSRTSGAPMVHLASGVLVAPEAVFSTPIGHPNDASENLLPNFVQTVGSGVCVTSSSL